MQSAVAPHSQTLVKSCAVKTDASPRFARGAIGASARKPRMQRESIASEPVQDNVVRSFDRSPLLDHKMKRGRSPVAKENFLVRPIVRRESGALTTFTFNDHEPVFASFERAARVEKSTMKGTSQGALVLRESTEATNGVLKCDDKLCALPGVLHE